MENVCLSEARSPHLISKLIQSGIVLVFSSLFYSDVCLMCIELLMYYCVYTMSLIFGN